MEGRFISKDPIGFEGGLNLYAYTDNNPINLTDPSGNMAGALPQICTFAGLALGAAVATICNPPKLPPNNDDCDDGCAKLTAQINAHIAGMKKKYNDMLTDQYGLFNNNSTTGSFGTWQGHVFRYEGLRIGLTKMVANAKAKGCSIPQEAYIWMNKPAPTRPGN